MGDGLTKAGLGDNLRRLLSFVRITIVFSILRTALGLQQSPPNQVLVALALFLTFFIMSPTIEKSYNDGLKPLLDETIGEEEAMPIIVEPFRKFMLDNVDMTPLQSTSCVCTGYLEPGTSTALQLCSRG